MRSSAGAPGKNLGAGVPLEEKLDRVLEHHGQEIEGGVPSSQKALGSYRHHFPYSLVSQEPPVPPKGLVTSSH